MAYSRNFLTTAGASFDIAPIQAGVPVLDQDLNLFQTAQFEARREYLRRETPSGWLDEIQHQPVVAANSAANIGQIYCTGNDLDLRIRGDLDVIVDGMVVRLSHCCGQSSQPAGDASSPFSGITLPAAPSPTFQPANGVTSRVGSRVDLVFLEVWRKEITVPASNSAADRRLAGLADDGNYFNYGNTQPGTSTLPTLTNDMVDPAVGGETCRRVQTQYRLRVWQDVDASSTTHPLAQSVKAWPSHKRTSSDGVGESTYTYSAVPDDVGLFRAGDGSTAAKSALGTFDGYCYAIPIALVSRRNTGAWSYTNFNGSTGRPDGKTANIHADDILDLRHNVAVGNKFDLKKLYETTRNLVLTCDLRTSYEEWMMNADGDNEYNPTGIYGTKLLRVEGVAGYASPINNSFQQTYQLQHNKVAQNGISTALDGMRNYFSDVGGDQAVFGMIPNVGSDGVGSSPQLFASYTASTRTLVLNAANMQSGGGTDPNRTKISVREPQLIWGKVGSHPHSGRDKSNSFKVSGTWFGLGTDSASFVIDDFTYFIADFAGVIPDSVNVGDVYKSSNNVDCIVAGFGNPRSYFVTFKYYGTIVPQAGAMTKVSGNGPSTITPKYYFDRFMYSVLDTTGIKVGDVYSSPDGLSFKVVFISGNIIYAQKLNPTSYTDPATQLGTWTKVSGNGPSTITTTAAFFQYGDVWSIRDARSVYVGVGSNFVPSDSPILITAYVTFAPGSGVLSRIPYRDYNSIKATHFNLNVSGNPVQQLPNNGIGFIPFGTSVDYVYDNNGPGHDTHTRQTGMVGFVYKNYVIDVGTNSQGYDVLTCEYPFVMKDGSVYKMWYSGRDSAHRFRILYSTSSDGIAWSTPVLAMDIGTEPNGYNSQSSFQCCVIKDGSTYKMWFAGLSNSDSKQRILYSTSSDGIAWSTPVLAMDIVTEPNGFNNLESKCPCVIKDGSTYKMWFIGIKDTNILNKNILYSTSSDGIAWSTPRQVTTHLFSGHDFSYNDNFHMSVIKEGSIYKMWLSAKREKFRILYLISTDGVNWSKPEVCIDGLLDFDLSSSQICQLAVIKDNKLYKGWFCARSLSSNKRTIFHIVFSMTDPNNTGSSTTGVYPTTGSLNLAPPADSQVVIMYEALSTKTAILDASYVPDFIGDYYVSTFGTGSYVWLGYEHYPMPKFKDLGNFLLPGLKSYLVNPVEIPYSEINTHIDNSLARYLRKIDKSDCRLVSLSGLGDIRDGHILPDYTNSLSINYELPFNVVFSAGVPVSLVTPLGPVVSNAGVHSMPEITRFDQFKFSNYLIGFSVVRKSKEYLLLASIMSPRHGVGSFYSDLKVFNIPGRPVLK